MLELLTGMSGPGKRGVPLPFRNPMGLYEILHTRSQDFAQEATKSLHSNEEVCSSIKKEVSLFFVQKSKGL